MFTKHHRNVLGDTDGINTLPANPNPSPYRPKTHTHTHTQISDSSDNEESLSRVERYVTAASSLYVLAQINSEVHHAETKIRTGKVSNFIVCVKRSVLLIAAFSNAT